MKIEDNKLGAALAGRLKSSPDGPCLNDEQIAALIDGQLSESEIKTYRRHLVSCHSCYEIYSLSTDTLPASKAKTPLQKYRAVGIAASLVFVIFMGIYFMNEYRDSERMEAPAVVKFKKADRKAVGESDPVSDRSSLKLGKKSKGVPGSKMEEAEKSYQSSGGIDYTKKIRAERSVKIERKKKVPPAEPTKASTLSKEKSGDHLDGADLVKDTEYARPIPTDKGGKKKASNLRKARIKGKIAHKPERIKEIAAVREQEKKGVETESKENLAPKNDPKTKRDKITAKTVVASTGSKSASDDEGYKLEEAVTQSGKRLNDAKKSNDDKRRSKSPVPLMGYSNKYQINFEYFSLKDEGYFYKGKSTFKKLTPAKRSTLLKKWLALYPKLAGEKKKVAKETIRFLKEFQR